MNSKEALKRIEEELYLILPKNIRQELIGIIKQSLDRLEQLEKENKELKDINEINKKIEVKSFELINENTKLKKVINLLKEHFELFYNKYNDTYEIKANLPLSTIISKITYELLKSVLEEE